MERPIIHKPAKPWQVRIGAVLLLLAGSTAAPALAQSQSTVVMAASCASCHGPGGGSPGAIPSINRLSAPDMAKKLRDYRAGQLEPTIMNRIAKGYTDAEIDALAQYFAALAR